MVENETETWAAWSKHVLLELIRLNEENTRNRKCISSLKTQIAILQVKAGLWGAAAGLLSALALYFLKQGG